MHGFYKNDSIVTSHGSTAAKFPFPFFLKIHHKALSVRIYEQFCLVWHQLIIMYDKADAIMKDRMTAQVHRVKLKGETKRKTKIYPGT